MPQPIAFAAWEPDKSDRINPTAEAKGCISIAGQYGPFPDIQNYGPASTIDANTIVYLQMDGADATTAFPDDAPTPHTFTAAGNAQVDTAQSKFGGASLLCDGAGDWITTPDNANLSLGSGDFTLEAFFSVSVAGGTTQRLAGQMAVGLAAATGAWYIERHTTNVIRAFVSNGAALTTVTGTTTFVSMTGTFAHAALVRTGNTLKLFINGVQEGGDVGFSGAVNDSANNYRVGAAGEETTSPWTGWIDGFRHSNVARWTANFTPPTVPYNFGGGGANVVLGADTFYDSTTAPNIFFGDATKLYKLVSRMAVDVSKAGGYAVGGSDTWQLAQFGNNVVAVSRNVAPQSYTMGTSVDFADLAGSPPSGATSVARVSDFLWLGKDFTVNWSGFNNITTWTPDPGTQAGNQQLDQERGEIIALVGLDYAAIFQERGVRRAIYVGPPVIWDFGQDYVEKARGCIARNAAVPFGRVIFYAADDGFYVFDGQSSTPIGYGKVDEYFTRNLNYAFRHKVSVGIDYSRKLVVFGFPAGSNQFISELLMFSIQDGRWTHDVLDLEFLFDTPAEPFNVDNFNLLFPANDLDGVISPNDIDSAAFDDRRIRLAGFQTGTHQLGLFTGAARAATIDTKEFEPSPGQRALLTEVWPMGDYPSGTVSASVGYRRALPGDPVTFTNPAQMNRVGYCPQRIDARFMRIRQQITAGAAWRRGEGVHFTATPTGGR